MVLRASHPPVILGIESSCDETAAAVVRGGHHVLSNVIATQHDLHERYAGVVPEIASRAHIERITPVIRQAMERADVSYGDLTAVAVGNRPGLIGSLLVGVSAAKALAWSLGIPIIGVDHLHAHLFAGLLDEEPVEFPALGLVVSGGHTSLYILRSPLDVRLIGHTIDDAIGEAYDKAATILQLGYPGGPRLDKLAQLGNEDAHDLPVSMLGKTSLDFSFSGLKTSLLYAVCGQPVGRGSDAALPRDASMLTDVEKSDFAASFQRAAVSAILLKVRRALKTYKVKTLLTGGGVTANSRLRKELTDLAKARGMDVRLPRMAYCLDNAAMIAGYAAWKYEAGRFDDWSLAASPRAAIGV
ncbi:MAG TPA: tRNA (adenosine(37)-N6)-threonylcarbamoyltransferase complex transferase subunit TsaD [Phycisphaerales bacterium]|nr:tRNA (adenosine(37)-N6)-threonylcarbamoyltransferase complex transferase subunit TsaD [Phycisphaerales bacterium]HRQ76575.1 tRNA (adenosine(37)-N6)-threonylcarbamoyltransferase complex transferase subunit TsaD [Phycisphaerales bacterium]